METPAHPENVTLPYITKVAVEDPTVLVGVAALPHGWDAATPNVAEVNS